VQNYSGDRAYYENRETEERSLAEPAEGVRYTGEEEDQDFEESYGKADNMDEGLLNAQSQWLRYTNGGRAYYWDR